MFVVSRDCHTYTYTFVDSRALEPPEVTFVDSRTRSSTLVHVRRLSYTFVDSRTRSSTLVTFVDSRTRSLTLELQSLRRSRSSTLELQSPRRSRSSTLGIPSSHSSSLFLVMFSRREFVTPAIVRTYRYVVYCAGGPPPGIVSCAYAIYSFLFMAAYCLLPLLVRVHGYSRSCFLCMCKCMCRCTCMSCAGAVQVRCIAGAGHVTYGCSFR